ncbi:peptidase M3A and M3B thimet/oligopeptidase F [Marinithermus hydrothermalis DSM 14884]|uniref:Peptidase M3A and M3B thimet/oligopeptidase F n=2 Tax=Marinithermus TaxID=186191 RepID=F2NR66_MARHT|nr:peptidase M3A and M3B thimet/oligopeptidase F [Marinithermus hydrothermalis DSM 14884]
MIKVMSAYSQTRWRLDDLLAGTGHPDLDAALRALDEAVTAFEAVRDELGPELTEARFREILDRLEAITELAHSAYALAGLRFAEDTQDPEAQAALARVRQRIAELQNRTLFFELWWKNLEDAAAARLMQGETTRRYWLEHLRAFRAHTLSEPEERIINLKNVTGRQALDTLYDSITNRYTFRLEVDGETKELTRGELMVYARDARPEVRAAAYRELYRVYGADGPILGQIYQGIVQDWRNEYVRLRGFKTPIAARNKMNDLPDEAVEALLTVCRENASLFQRYFRLKARWLGMERLRRYDIYAPVSESKRTYPFAEAVEMVRVAFERFHPRFAELALRVFEAGHVDSEVRKGKQGGAFCWSPSPRLVPWVLLNYQGRVEDVSTMAHELGHAIHAMLAGHHSIFTFHAPLPLAETASTFGEMLLVDYLLEEERDPAVRRDILFAQVDDNYATILRQAFFALFEQTAHEMIAEGATTEALAQAYLENLALQFGDAVEVGEEFRWEWVSIPHIYGTPFYVYAYAFGQLLVLALYRQYRAEGEAFKPRLERILAAGGSVAPAELLAREGIDVRDAAFWQGGFEVFEGLIRTLEAEPLPQQA